MHQYNIKTIHQHLTVTGEIKFLVEHGLLIKKLTFKAICMVVSKNAA